MEEAHQDRGRSICVDIVPLLDSGIDFLTNNYQMQDSRKAK